jgi:hypothetical protein
MMFTVHATVVESLRCSLAGKTVSQGSAPGFPRPRAVPSLFCHHHCSAYQSSIIFSFEERLNHGLLIFAPENRFPIIYFP